MFARATLDMNPLELEAKTRGGMGGATGGPGPPQILKKQII
jgi:hypothetical protein